MHKYQDRHFSEWAASSLGQSLLALEKRALRDNLANLRGGIAVQIGSSGPQPLLDACHYAHRFLLTAPGQPADSTSTGILHAATDSLPFESNSVDLCLLPHSLDFSAIPHELLREVDRVLVSGGRLVLLGFNPYSMWGLRKMFAFRTTGVPWNGRFISMRRLRDWLQLLDFDIHTGTMLYYRPPSGSHAMRDRLAFLEKAGNRWWPMLAAVYLLVAQKNEAGMTVIEMNRSFRKVSYLNAAEPVAMQGRR
jgi:SAM-dependent methyltransferase